ncbi:PREDICTED: telomere repeats-binding bouquet formation protein 1-like, partial [Acanthisitta chloris]|uniref:telomere repeats-binding bouquet formation protein 1-like n=1 Tax=Acanthisitta chloris TaxID=57068 RepID=UPI0004F0F72B
ENQCELLQNNGLPLMIQVLTESQDEELIKAATFVLQNCKQMTEQLSLKTSGNSPSVDNAEELDVNIRRRSLQEYWKNAKEILHRINMIEQEVDEERLKGRVFVDGSSAANPEALEPHEVTPADPKTGIERTHKEVHCPQLSSRLDDQVLLAPSANSPPRKHETVNPMDPVSTRQRGQSHIPCSANELPRDSVLQTHSVNDRTACVKNQSVLQASKELFRQPAEAVRNGRQTCTSDQGSFYSEKTGKDRSTAATSSSHKMSDLRCSGCTAEGLSFNSKTFTKMLQSCPHQCDHHKVILEAEERYRKDLRKWAGYDNTRCTAQQGILLTPKRKSKPNTSGRDEHSKNMWTDNYSLIPACEKSLQKTQDANLRRQGVKEMYNQQHQHLQDCEHSLQKAVNNEMCSQDMSTRTLNKRRTRKDFTAEEIKCLLNGVKKMGNHWNLILWSYPFQKGRTSVDLSKKYHRLQLQVRDTVRARDVQVRDTPGSPVQ